MKVYKYISHLERIIERKLKKPCDVVFRKANDSLIITVYCVDLRYNEMFNMDMVEAARYSSTDADEAFCDKVVKAFKKECEDDV